MNVPIEKAMLDHVVNTSGVPIDGKRALSNH